MAKILDRYEAGLLFPARSIVKTSWSLYRFIYKETEKRLEKALSRISRKLLQDIIDREVKNVFPESKVYVYGKKINLQIIILEIVDSVARIKICFPLEGGTAEECQLIFQALINKFALDAEASLLGLELKILLSGNMEPAEIKIFKNPFNGNGNGQKMFIAKKEILLFGFC